MDVTQRQTGFLVADGLGTPSGTAWLVGRNLAVTAAHVVGDQQSRSLYRRKWNLVLYGPNRNKQEIVVESVRPAWEIDAALLFLRGPLSMPLRRPIMRVLAEPSGNRWKAAGFPSGSVPGRRITLDGEVTDRDDSRPPSRTLQLLCFQEGNPELEKMGIDGMSGAAIVVNDAIVGIVTSLEKFAEGRILYGTPIEALANAFEEIDVILNPLKRSEDFENAPDVTKDAQFNTLEFYRYPDSSQLLDARSIIADHEYDSPLMLFVNFPADVPVLSVEIGKLVDDRDICWAKLGRILRQSNHKWKSAARSDQGLKALLLDALYRRGLEGKETVESWREFAAAHEGTRCTFVLYLDSESPLDLLEQLREDDKRDKDESLAESIAEFTLWAREEGHLVVTVLPRVAMLSRHFEAAATKYKSCWHIRAFEEHFDATATIEMPLEEMRSVLGLTSATLQVKVKEHLERGGGSFRSSMESLIAELVRDGYWEPAYRLELIQEAEKKGKNNYVVGADMFFRSDGSSSGDAVGFVPDVREIPTALDGVWALTGFPSSGKSNSLRAIRGHWASCRFGAAKPWLPLELSLVEHATLHESIAGASAGNRLAHDFYSQLKSDRELKWTASSSWLVLADIPEDFTREAWEALQEQIAVVSGGAIVTSSDYYSLPFAATREIRLRSLEHRVIKELEASFEKKKRIELMYESVSLPISRCLRSPFFLSLILALDIEADDLSGLTAYSLMNIWALSRIGGGLYGHTELNRAAEVLGQRALGTASANRLMPNDLARWKKMGFVEGEVDRIYFPHSLIRVYFGVCFLLREATSNLQAATAQLSAFPANLSASAESMFFAGLNTEQRVRLAKLGIMDSRKICQLLGELPHLSREETQLAKELSDVLSRSIGSRQSGAMNRGAWQECLADARAMGRFDQRISLPHGKSNLVPIAAANVLLSRYLVTNLEFERFVQDGGYSNARWWQRSAFEWLRARSIRFPEYWLDEDFREPNLPVVGVSLHEARAYCQWLNQDNGSKLRHTLVQPRTWVAALHLSNEPLSKILEEINSGSVSIDDKAWEAIVEQWRDQLREVGPYAIGTWPSSSSGFYDLWGNIWEWCDLSQFEGETRRGDGAKSIVVGGPAGRHYQEFATLFGTGLAPEQRLQNVGFRVAAHAITEESC
jgi:formylglycine-generating enzyme required for sulfatase activity